MKKIKRAQMVAVAILLLGIASTSIGAVYAAEMSAKANPMSDLVSAIAQKFNLNQNEVQAIFDEHRTKMQTQRGQNRAQMEAKRNEEFATRLKQAVTDGKLTQAQADLINAKIKDLEAQRASLEGKSRAERRSAMQAQRESLKKWMSDNNIPEGYLPFGGGMGMGKGRGIGMGCGGGMGMGCQNADCQK